MREISMKQLYKRFLSFLLSAVLSLSFLSCIPAIPVHAASSIPSDALYYNGDGHLYKTSDPFAAVPVKTEVSSSEVPGWSVSASGDTLTLNGLSYMTTNPCALYIANAGVVVEGTNSVTSLYEPTADRLTQNSYGIYFAGTSGAASKISGSGTLLAQTSDCSLMTQIPLAHEVNTCAVYGAYGLTFSGNVRASFQAADIVFNGSPAGSVLSESDGIRTEGPLTVTDTCMLTSAGGNAITNGNASGFGIRASGNISVSGTDANHHASLSATGGIRIGSDGGTTEGAAIRSDASVSLKYADLIIGGSSSPVTTAGLYAPDGKVVFERSNAGIYASQGALSAESLGVLNSSLTFSGGDTAVSLSGKAGIAGSTVSASGKKTAISAAGGITLADGMGVISPSGGMLSTDKTTIVDGNDAAAASAAIGSVADLAKLTVSFDANGGSGTMESISVSSGTDASLPENTFSRTGYRFLSWNTAKDGSGTACSDGGTVRAVRKDMQLYAQWVKAPAKDGKLTSYAGQNRFETMEMLIGSGSFRTGGTAILATGISYADALAAAGLSGLDNAPIILTETDALSTEAKAILQALQPKTVFIAGGKGAISAEAELEARELLPAASFERFDGSDRFDTAMKIYKNGTGWGKQAIIVDGQNFADALSVAPYAYAAGCPIFLSNEQTGLTDAEISAVNSGSFTGAVLVGGVHAVPESVVTDQIKVPSIRLASDTRFTTCSAFNEWAVGASDALIQPLVKLSYSQPAVASGTDFADALSGAAFCGAQKSVLLLANEGDGGMACISISLKNHAGSASGVTILGGTGAVADSVRTAIRAVLG